VNPALSTASATDMALQHPQCGLLLWRAARAYRDSLAAAIAGGRGLLDAAGVGRAPQHVDLVGPLACTTRERV
jgi:hypothetical protein